MSEQAAGINVEKADLEGNRKRKADGQYTSGTGIAKEVRMRTSRTSILDLNEDCCRFIMDFLNVGDQLSLASSHLYFGEMFQRYASHRYKHINESLTSRTSNEILKQLLQIVGEDLVSYESEFNRSSTGDQHLWLLRSLRSHCTNLKHLKMTFGRTRGGWDDLYSLKQLQSLHADLDMGDRWCSDFVYNLKQLPCLRKLRLRAVSYSGRDLHVLDQLVFLDVDYCDGLEGKSLTDCCQTMKKLRHLDFGCLQNFSKSTFEILLTNCQQLQSLVFDVGHLDSTVPYEMLCHLPRLRYLKVWTDSLRDSFIEGLINKQGSPLESLFLEGCALSADQIKHLCNISTLKELLVNCDTVPLEDLVKLKSLLNLHISMPITTVQIVDLLQGLPCLKFLNILDRDDIDKVNLGRSVHTWMSEQREQQRKIKVCLSNSYTDDILWLESSG
ncbi:uncharacterized protein LOC108164326 [Drosophila miranda]|uniref:uncharacterized protein LOC108164326 n=1 Tax=Drosophila miranda TaxID=7229 RepID=UPI0007E7FE2A|nr:uncharacterized protein LOC108164326 [Drosophila miranda]